MIYQLYHYYTYNYFYYYIYELIRKGYLPAIKLGSLKVLKSSLERFLIQNEGKDLSNLSDIKKIVIEVEVNE